MRSLVTSRGEISVPATILEELKTFYGQLNRGRSLKTEAQCNEYLKEINTSHLSTDDIDSCEGKLSIKECFEALTAMHSNKPPGNDGLSKEFCLAFFQTLGSDLIECLNNSFQEGEMSSSQKQAVITLIEKKDQDKRYIKDWRPISLLDVDVKILSKVLPIRIKG